MKKKVFSALTAALLSVSILAGCSQDTKETAKKTDDKKKETVAVTLNEVAHSIFYAPMYVAIEEGYFEEEGIDLKLVTGFGADKTMTAVLSSQADIGFMGSESSIYTYNEGAKDYVVNFAQLTQRAGNFLVSREPLEDFQWTDLKGKTVLGGRKGGMPEMVFEYILKQNGIDPEKDLTINRNIDFGSTAAAFSGGQGDFTVEFEPGATTLEASDKGYVVASLGKDSGYVPYTAFSARKSYIEENPDVIQGFTDALQKGMDYVNSHTSEEIAKIIQPQFKENDLETITTIVSRYHEQETWKEDLIFNEESFELLQDILEDAGYRVGLLGTIEQFDGEKSIPSVHTTPDAVCLHRELGRMRENGCDICVMEVSSQALKLERTYGIMFDIGIFLNLGKDHISRFEHSDEAEYLECKRKLFLQSDFGVGNRDDKRYDAVFRDTPCRKITYGIRSGRFRAENIFTDTWVDGRPGVIFTQDKTEYAIPVPGEYTVYNALAAIAVCRMMGVDKEKIRKTLRQFSVKGRAEFIKIPGGAVAVIDYAHNAMSLKSFLDTMRKYRPHRLITVFGCGGGRAKDRRYEMGRVSGLLSDLTVITSDNPRWENPEDIMEDIEEGIRETKGDYIKIPDRRKAVDFAVGMAREGDIIVVAGKGHETYQEIQGIKYEMDERRLVEEACMHRSA